MNNQYWDGNPEKWTIASNDKYVIFGEYEEANLFDLNGKYISCVGDFYGGPIGGIIDKNNNFCVTIGCGVIIYMLKEPFETYMYNKNTSQWLEYDREPNKIIWYKKVEQITDNIIELTDEFGNKRRIDVNL